MAKLACWLLETRIAHVFQSTSKFASPRRIHLETKRIHHFDEFAMLQCSCYHVHLTCFAMQFILAYSFLFFSLVCCKYNVVAVFFSICQKNGYNMPSEHVTMMVHGARCWVYVRKNKSTSPKTHELHESLST